MAKMALLCCTALLLVPALSQADAPATIPEPTDAPDIASDAPEGDAHAPASVSGGDLTLGQCFIGFFRGPHELPDEVYRRAVREIDLGHWEVAEGLLRESIAREPVERPRLVNLYGLRFAPYLPHYLLGVALAERGDTEGARQAFACSSSQGAITGTSWREELDRRVETLGG